MKRRTFIKGGAVNELTAAQNACLEAAEEEAAEEAFVAKDRSGLVSARDVVVHVSRALANGETATIAGPISRAQASRALRQLCS